MHTYMWHDSFICVTWLFHVCDTCLDYFIEHDPAHLRSPSNTCIRCVTWLIHMCDMTPSYVWHDIFISSSTKLPSGLLSLTNSHMCDVTHSYVWHDSFICVTWLDHFIEHDLAHLRSPSNTYIRCVTWLIHMYDVAHSYVGHDSFILWSTKLPRGFLSNSFNEFIHPRCWNTCIRCVTWPLHMCDITLSYAWHDSFICVM